MASTNDTPVYKIIRVPRNSSRLADLVTKSRSARLHALQTDPTSFLSLHATESALPLHVWRKRLCDPEITVLACVALCPTAHSPANDNSPDSTEHLDNEISLDDETALLTGEWVGFAAVRGPMSKGEYYVTPDMGLPVPERPEEEKRWHLFDLYTLPAHRGRGLARKLVEECARVAVEGTGTFLAPASNVDGLEGQLGATSGSKLNGSRWREDHVKQARIRLFMDPKNPWLVKMYEGFGFKTVGKVTLEEGFRANKLDDSVPADTRASLELEKMWHTRFGLAMEQIIGVGEGGERRP